MVIPFCVPLCAFIGYFRIMHTFVKRYWPFHLAYPWFWIDSLGTALIIRIRQLIMAAWFLLLAIVLPPLCRHWFVLQRLFNLLALTDVNQSRNRRGLDHHFLQPEEDKWRISREPQFFWMKPLIRWANIITHLALIWLIHFCLINIYIYIYIWVYCN